MTNGSQLENTALGGHWPLTLIMERVPMFFPAAGKWKSMFLENSG